jgi:hypothetical protein
MVTLSVEEAGPATAAATVPPPLLLLLLLLLFTFLSPRFGAAAIVD